MLALHSLVPIYTPGGRVLGHCESSAQEHNTKSQARAQTWTPDPEMSTWVESPGAL